jgi:hypothetical protein
VWYFLLLILLRKLKSIKTQSRTTTIHDDKVTKAYEGQHLRREFTNIIVCLIVFSATFNNISVILWRTVLLVEETGGPGENHRPVASH